MSVWSLKKKKKLWNTLTRRKKVMERYTYLTLMVCEWIKNVKERGHQIGKQEPEMLKKKNEDNQSNYDSWGRKFPPANLYPINLRHEKRKILSPTPTNYSMGTMTTLFDLQDSKRCREKYRGDLEKEKWREPQHDPLLENPRNPWAYSPACQPPCPTTLATQEKKEEQRSFAFRSDPNGYIHEFQDFHAENKNNKVF